MPQVSKYPVSKVVYRRVFDIFLNAVSGLKGKRQTSEFLREFLSPTEQVMLTKRLAIAFLIEKGYAYREISQILRVSTGTVAKVSLIYRSGDSFKKLVRKILSDEKINKFWMDVGEKVTTLLSSSRSKAGSWAYLKEEIRKKRQEDPF